MSPQRTKWNDAEHEVLVKLHHGYTLSRQDHATLAKMYEVHGPNPIHGALTSLAAGRAIRPMKELTAAYKQGSRKS
jgi:hypothetical protein